MNSLKTLLTNKVILIFIFFLLLHSILFNINSVEWGDSYRILRASEYVRSFTYPTDEKRPPLFSILLALRPNGVDQVVWGKGILLYISVLSFLVFYKLSKLFFTSSRDINLSLLLFALNPIYFYWSLRLYADVPLSLLVLIAFYLLTKWKNSLTIQKLFVIAIVTSLAVMTRFEGYLLFAAVLVGVFFVSKKKIVDSFWYGISFCFLLIPYLYFRNPLTSSYFEEPANRKFDLETLATYALSLLFVFGLVYATFFIYKGKSKILDFLKNNVGITAFVLLNLVLVLLWPAAVPRLFVSALPLFIIILVIGISAYFDENRRFTKFDVVLLVASFGIFALGQFRYRLQFLIPNSLVLYIVLFIQLPTAYFILKQKYNYFLICVVLSLSIWTVNTVYLHKDIYTSLKQAAEYTQLNLEGEVLYNDTSSVSDWYLNEKSTTDQVKGKYANFDNKDTLTQEYLKSNNINYLLISNEHNPNLEIDLAKRPYLRLLREFTYTHGGKVFFTKVVEVNV